MPKKLNFLGGQQNYDADTGKYEPALVGANGEVPSSFKKFKKEPSEFDKTNEKRMGKVKKEKKKNYTEYNESEISEALGDAEWTITDKTTVEDYANHVAEQLNADPQDVLAVIKKENPNIQNDAKMADVIENYGKEDSEAEGNPYDPEDLPDEGMSQEELDKKANGIKQEPKKEEKAAKPEKPVEKQEVEEPELDEYESSLKEEIYNLAKKTMTYEQAQEKYELMKKQYGENHGGTLGLKKALDEMAKNSGKGQNKVKKPKEIDSYTDKLFKDLNVKTFVSKKYKNQNGEVVEIRRFGDGQNAIRYNETKDEVEQVWLNGERIK